MMSYCPLSLSNFTLSKPRLHPKLHTNLSRYLFRITITANKYVLYECDMNNRNEYNVNDLPVSVALLHCDS